VERGLRDLRRQVAQAQRHVPDVPAIEARLDEEHKHLKAKQARLEHELALVKDKFGKLRVNQSITDYNLAQLRKQEAAPKTEVEFETSTSRFVMRNVHPEAAQALREFASQVIDAKDGGAIWFADPAAGNA
jgi:hypothetical protein